MAEKVRPDGGRGQYETDEYRSTIMLSNLIETPGGGVESVFDDAIDRDEHVT
jgi:hypothetical protein